MFLSPDDNNDYRLLETVFDTIEDGILVMDREFTIVRANRWMESRHPATGPLVGRKCYSALHKRTEICEDCPYVASLKTGTRQTQVMKDSSDEGLPKWFEVSAYPLTDAEGAAVGVIEHVSDITELKQTEELLRDEICRRRIMVEQSRDGIVILDQDGSVFEANEQFARMLGYTLEEAYQLEVFDWEVAHPREEVLEMIAAVDDQGDHFETRHRRKDGTFLEVEISSNGAVYNGRKLVFCVCRDITEKKAMERQIRELAIRDCLTEIFNRRYIFERLAEMVAEYSRDGTGFCVSILDIDHFKTVNDIHGHQAGDYALIEFASTVGSMIRPYDLLGRYGGEEFVIVSRTAGAWETGAMVERIMDTVRHKAFVFEGREIRFTFSCGLADSSEFSREDLTTEAIISLADERLYDAKAAGRNRCVGPAGLLQGCADANGQSVLSSR